MKHYFSLTILIAMVGLLSCCTRHTDNYWAKTDNWFISHDNAMYDVDVFYIVSVNVISDYTNQHEVFNATLTKEQRELYNQEMVYIKHTIGDSLNMYSPYYHQFTMRATTLSKDSFDVAYNIAKRDVEEAFEYYITHINTNRPFVLAGFSQGAMMVKELLMSMPDEAYERCLAAYMMGYRLSQQDIVHPRIEAATSSTDGKVISFNSVVKPEDQWDLVSKDAAACINPVNWTTDATPATLYYCDDTITVVQDTINHVLLCDIDVDEYPQPGAGIWYKPGCLHYWDILFYTESLRQNILLRIKSNKL